MAKVLDEQSRKAVADTIRYYRDLGIYDLYQRAVPEGMTFGQAIEREELAAIEGGAPAAAANEAVREEPAVNAAHLAAMLNDKPAALRVIRADIGDWRVLHNPGKPCKNNIGFVFTAIAWRQIPPGAPARIKYL